MSDSAGRGWKVTCLVLLVLLAVSASVNLLQLRERGSLRGEASGLGASLAAEVDRAQAAVRESRALRSAANDLHANMAALQESLAALMEQSAALAVAEAPEPLAAAEGPVAVPGRSEVVVEDPSLSHPSPLGPGWARSADAYSLVADELEKR